MLKVNKKLPVMVSGATGYVAGVLIKELLSHGLSVHAAVRDPDNEEKVKYLNQIANDSEGSIKYFKSELLMHGSYAEAMQGCQVVFHTASPFSLDVKDPRKELVEPALLGTRNVLEQANKISSVERVVLTSSCAAIYGDNVDLKKTSNNIFTEKDWNTTSSLEHNPYSYSKVMAEKEAWEIYQKQSQWELVVVNPSLVIGPGINPNATSESFNILKKLGDGTMEGGVPDYGMGLVDVRDVAQVHLAAAFNSSAKGRYICSGHNSSFPEMVAVLKEKYGDTYPLPKRTLPKILVWLFGPLLDKSITRESVAKNVNYPWRGDNSKSREELGVSYRSLKESMEDFFQQLIDARKLNPKKRRPYR